MTIRLIDVWKYLFLYNADDGWAVGNGKKQEILFKYI